MKYILAILSLLVFPLTVLGHGSHDDHGPTLTKAGGARFAFKVHLTKTGKDRFSLLVPLDKKNAFDSVKDEHWIGKRMVLHLGELHWSGRVDPRGRINSSEVKARLIARGKKLRIDLKNTDLSTLTSSMLNSNEIDLELRICVFEFDPENPDAVCPDEDHEHDDHDDDHPESEIVHATIEFELKQNKNVIIGKFK